MLVQEMLENNLVRTYSNEGKYIIQNNTDKYTEAVDLADLIDNGSIVYTESDEYIEIIEEEDENAEELPEGDEYIHLDEQ